MSAEQPHIKAEDLLSKLLQKDAKAIQLLQQLNASEPSVLYDALGIS